MEDDENDYDRVEQHRSALEALIREDIKRFPEKSLRDLSEAVYAFNERGLWDGDIEFKDITEVIRIWALVERVIQKGFPPELGM